jgi:Cof subfamily protein (haloacid dehalogenase superfamily)
MPSESSKGILILDIDGTVIDSPSQDQPSAAVTVAIKKASEKYTVSLATGRTWPWTKRVVELLDIKSPCIVAGGTEIRGADGTVLWQESIPTESIQTAVEVFSEFKDKLFLIDDYSLEEYLSGGTVSYDSLLMKKEIREFQLPFLTRQQADELENKIKLVPGVTGVKTTSFREGLADLHVMSSFATKEHAITELLKITQIDVDKTIGVGDGHNDLHIFAAVKHKIAMGNAVPEMKEAADRVIGRVDEDGLATFLEELVARD